MDLGLSREDAASDFYSAMIDSRLKLRYWDENHVSDRVITKEIRFDEIDWDKSSVEMLPQWLRKPGDWRANRPAIRLVEVLAEDVASIWGEADGKSQKADPYRTGLPGRPGIKHLILQEFLKRVESRKVLSTLNEQAQALQAWASQAHPEAPPASIGTIRNHIRNAYRRAHARKP